MEEEEEEEEAPYQQLCCVRLSVLMSIPERARQVSGQDSWRGRITAGEVYQQCEELTCGATPEAVHPPPQRNEPLFLSH